MLMLVLWWGGLFAPPSLHGTKEPSTGPGFSFPVFLVVCISLTALLTCLSVVTGRSPHVDSSKFAGRCRNVVQGTAALLLSLVPSLFIFGTENVASDVIVFPGTSSRQVFFRAGVVPFREVRCVMTVVAIATQVGKALFRAVVVAFVKKRKKLFVLF